ncbi:hypothetical protein ASPWEDRAFT_38547 [Aspergillus wentii DTO 134E9]|uniref:Uncharacterized protein n=1 Tax=Aspergillus wentii DTO 134E9 TaxID=1073089 RepID=A0A1L9RPM7_ASPWE|nr:uncharacterized protein ASPWEDRAFT_38547 [Aspergillus wentii DTO 134E9]KAI9924070.1 hypothetical protein MW887_007309 [Aspergillus wentii]OJJ36891.1 hypothetical protein ASPWEDRAFT_38547 [Aspergillus wentii DTO 134E9]
MKAFLWAFALTSAICARANEWHAYYRLNPNEYQTKFDSMVSQGYRVNSISGYERNNEPNYAVIFEKNPCSPAWRSHSGLTSDAYHAKFEEYLDQGYRVSQVNGYTVNGKDYYAAIWDKTSNSSAAWVSRHGMSTGWMQKYFDTYLEQGYTLTHVSGYEVGKEARYAAVWEKKNDGAKWVAAGNLTSTEYQDRFDKYVNEGYRLVDVDGYEVDGEVFYAAIWDKSASGPWVARHGMDSPSFQAEFDKYRAEGYVLKTLSGYNVGKKDWYAAIWVKP